MNYAWSARDFLTSFGPIIAGLWNSCALTVIVCAISTCLAVPLALGLRARHWTLALPATLFVETGKATPVLVLLIYVHYALLPSAQYRSTPMESAVIGFTISLASFLAEIFKESIDAIPRCRFETIRILGIGRLQAIRLILLPEIFRRSFVSTVNWYISLFKATTLASMIGFPDALHQARLIVASTPTPFETYSALAICFLVVVAPISKLTRYVGQSRWVALEPRS